MKLYEIDNGKCNNNNVQTMSDMNTGVAGLNHRSEVKYLRLLLIKFYHMHTYTHRVH